MRVYDVGCWLYDRDIISTYPTVVGQEMELVLVKVKQLPGSYERIGTMEGENHCKLRSHRYSLHIQFCLSICLLFFWFVYCDKL